MSQKVGATFSHALPSTAGANWYASECIFHLRSYFYQFSSYWIFKRKYLAFFHHTRVESVCGMCRIENAQIDERGIFISPLDSRRSDSPPEKSIETFVYGDCRSKAKSNSDIDHRKSEWQWLRLVVVPFVFRSLSLMGFFSHIPIDVIVSELLDQLSLIEITRNSVR